MNRNLRTTFAAFDARTPWFGLGRTVMALGELTILLFTPINALLVPVLSRPEAPYCDGIRAISLFCLGRPLGGPEVWQWVMVAILVLVATGFAPRWTVIPHALVAFSIAQSISLPDGGESVAQVMTLLFIPIGLMDGRRWHWTWPTSQQQGAQQAIALSASLFVRIQLGAIYLNSGIAKLATPAWIDGSAEFYIAQSKNFGAWGPIEPILTWFTSIPLGTAAISWGTIVLECLLGVLVLGTARMRLLGLALGILLHVGIVITIGLWSFGLVMIGALLVAANIDRATTMKVWDAIRRQKSDGFIDDPQSAPKNEKAHLA